MQWTSDCHWATQPPWHGTVCGCTPCNYCPSSLGTLKWTSRLPSRHDAKQQSRNGEFTQGFRVCPRHSPHSWACSALTLLISFLCDAVRQFPKLFVLCYCNIARRVGVAGSGNVWYMPLYDACDFIYNVRKAWGFIGDSLYVDIRHNPVYLCLI